MNKLRESLAILICTELNPVAPMWSYVKYKQKEGRFYKEVDRILEVINSSGFRLVKADESGDD